MSKRIGVWVALAATAWIAVPAMAQPTMDELWPNQDGLSWTYAQRYEDFDLTPSVVENRTRIFLDGTVIAPTAIQAQYLRQELISGPAFVESSEPALTDPFLRQLWIARPDLRTKILQVESDADCPETRAPGSYGYFLNGELAYLKTSGDIGAWRCNKSDTQAWLWLVSDVSVGNTFTLQLVPDLADDVFLHGEIVAVEPVTVPAGTFKNCVRVDYLVDYGFSTCYGQQRQPRSGRYGRRLEATSTTRPASARCESFEEFIPIAERIGSCGGPSVGAPVSRVSLQMDTTPTPVRRTTWGQIKLTYR